ncbi:MAG TPA: site-2 protease family protein [Phycisphaerae bacterium]|nr:site-2 protease family protein [Phycisphaerae bacterium]
MTLLMALTLLPGLVIGLTFHEMAHAWSASLLGDDFARRQGRVSLNPFRHLSLLGTLAIFLLPFGWAKPVVVNLYNFRHPKRDYLLTSLAGPAANLLVIALCFGLMQLTRHSYAFGPVGAVLLDLAHAFLVLAVLINAILATLNLLPIPPLDGSKIWPVLIPGLRPDFGGKWQRYSILLLLVLLWTGAIRPLFRYTVEAVYRIVPVTDSERFEESLRQGDEAYDRDDYARAVERYTAAIEINRGSPEAYRNRACARWGQDRFEGALADINAAQKVRPLPADDLAFRADVYDQLGRPDEAALDRAAARAMGWQPGPATQTAPATEPSTAPRVQ